MEPITQVLILSGIGFLISLYGLIEVSKMNKDPYYKPLCDISSSISCSKAFMSKFGSNFGLPNPLLGTLYYLALGILALNSLYIVIGYLATAALLFSLYLAYLLYFKIRTMCIVCTLVYAINILIFIIVIV
jgi:vitamin-K-epoxide reductase (warfarin-sensitive)